MVSTLDWQSGHLSPISAEISGPQFLYLLREVVEQAMPKGISSSIPT